MLAKKVIRRLVTAHPPATPTADTWHAQQIGRYTAAMLDSSLTDCHSASCDHGATRRCWSPATLPAAWSAAQAPFRMQQGTQIRPAATPAATSALTCALAAMSAASLVLSFSMAAMGACTGRVAMVTGATGGHLASVMAGQCRFSSTSCAAPAGAARAPPTAALRSRAAPERARPFVGLQQAAAWGPWRPPEPTRSTSVMALLQMDTLSKLGQFDTSRRACTPAPAATPSVPRRALPACGPCSGQRRRGAGCERGSCPPACCSAAAACAGMHSPPG